MSACSAMLLGFCIAVAGLSALAMVIASDAFRYRKSYGMGRSAVWALILMVAGGMCIGFVIAIAVNGLAC